MRDSRWRRPRTTSSPILRRGRASPSASVVSDPSDVTSRRAPVRPGARVLPRLSTLARDRSRLHGRGPCGRYLRPSASAPARGSKAFIDDDLNRPDASEPGGFRSVAFVSRRRHDEIGTARPNRSNRSEAPLCGKSHERAVSARKRSKALRETCARCGRPLNKLTRRQSPT
jgi:hypothetical protein